MTQNDTPSATAFIADNLALNFINSESGVGEQRQDSFHDDSSIADWLKMADVWPESLNPPVPAGLWAAACALRSAARSVVEAAMKGEPADLSVINLLLEAGRPVRRLVWHEETQAFSIVVQPADGSPASLLWPVADALASLVSGDKFAFVRQCEAHDCILLFHDLSKSHRRRWCSMATCGNRMKVASFRSRKKS